MIFVPKSAYNFYFCDISVRVSGLLEQQINPQMVHVDPPNRMHPGYTTRDGPKRIQPLDVKPYTSSTPIHLVTGNNTTS